MTKGFIAKWRASIKSRFPIVSTQIRYQLMQVSGRFERMRCPDLHAPAVGSMAVCVRVKDEARFLPEFVAHYLLLGFDHIFVYNNNSSDCLEEVMEPFVRLGKITIVDWPYKPAAPKCYLHFLGFHAERFEWVAFFDADEFLVEEYTGALRAALSASNAPALAINWRYFGGGGHQNVPTGLVLENFFRGNSRLDSHFKVVARPRSIVGYFNSHNFFYDRRQRASNVFGNLVLGSRCKLADAVPTLVLRHFVYRSRQDYERKSLSGFVDAAGSQEKARQLAFIEHEAEKHNDKAFQVSQKLVDDIEVFLRTLGYSQPYVKAAQRA